MRIAVSGTECGRRNGVVALERVLNEALALPGGGTKEMIKPI